MTRQQFCMIILWLQATGGKNLQWQTKDGRTIQISGREGMRGYWQRFLDTKPHPTRKALSEDEAFATFQDAAGEFVLYDLYVDQGEQFTAEKLFAKIQEVFP